MFTERGWPRYSFLVLFKSYLSCYLNPEYSLWFAFALIFSLQLDPVIQEGRDTKGVVPGIPFPVVFGPCSCRSSEWHLLCPFPLMRQGQRQLDESCGCGVADTFLGRWEGVRMTAQGAPRPATLPGSFWEESAKMDLLCKPEGKYQVSLHERL